MVLVKPPVPGRPTFRMKVGQGRIDLAVGAGGGCFGHFYSPILSLLFLPLSGRRPLQTEILSQRADKPSTTNKPNYQVAF